jgi:hypothetical protein
MRLLIAGAGFALLAVTPLQDVALKDLMPKGMVIGAAINQRQFDGVDTAAVEIITKQFNQISPENVLKVQPTHPAPTATPSKPRIATCSSASSTTCR